MGYERDSDKLSFEKALFSPHWKYLIHTILHCLSSKSTAWNEFSTNVASAEQLSDIPLSSQPQKTQRHRKGKKLSNRVLDLEKAMNAQANEIAILKKKVKKLEKRKRSRTQGSINAGGIFETSIGKSIVFKDVEESAKDQREGKAPMVEEDVPPPKKTQKQLDDERGRLEEAMRLQVEQEAKHAELMHLDHLLAQRI
ncbi:hypothetical protein Tco_0144447 [Tanacetum coccineum]